jgi:hypothetical protein
MRTYFHWFFGITTTLAAGGLIGACSSSSSGNETSCADGGTCPSGQFCNGNGVCEDISTGGTGGGSGGATGGSGGDTGGTGGATGGSGGATGGSGGGGGASCDPSLGTPGSCTPVDPSDTCQTCIEANCCPEWGRCIQENPFDNCGVGGPNGEGEATCFQQCVYAAGTADEITQGQCAGDCTTPNCGSISGATNELITCLNSSCFSECLQPSNP